MIDIETFLCLIDAFSASTGLSDTQIGSRMFNDGKGVKRLRAGRDIGVLTLKSKLLWLAEHWPPHEPWPSDIPRPAVDTQPPLAEAATD